MKKVTITRKIQVFLASTNETKKEDYKQIHKWIDLAYKAANQVATHLFFQENQRDFIYLGKRMKLILLDENIPNQELQSKVSNEVLTGAEPMLNTSRQNSTYRMLSNKYKGDLPSDVFNNINSLVIQNFDSEKQDYFTGAKSLRSYKKGMPFPFSARSVKNIHSTENNRDYYFSLFGLKFRTHFGNDRSRNKELWEKTMTGNHKLCNSSIKYSNGKFFLLASIQFEADLAVGLNEMKIVLPPSPPMIVKIGNIEFPIGDPSEFIHRRAAIRASFKRAQIVASHSKGGRGRKHKLRMLEKHKDYEQNYINTRIHQYSKKVLDLCLDHKCSKIILSKSPDFTSNTEYSVEKTDLQFSIHNWSPQSIIEKIKYKCNKHGIVFVEKN